MRKPIALVLLLLVAVVGAACGGDDPAIQSPPPNGATDEPTEEPTEEPDCDDQTASETAEIVMGDNFFTPSCLEANSEAALHLQNDGQARHTFTIPDLVDVTVSPGNAQDVPAPPPPPGQYTFYCKFHGTAEGGGMAGTLTIVG